ncbi:uncharacterized protein RHO25_000004 [Cercospora beticola]|nr:hypothetical protein RHO25_000004 [Cercospora beticola]
MRRKRVSAALAKTALFTSEPLRTTVDQILYQRLLPLIEGHQGLSLDILPLCYALSLDALTSTLLGAPAGTKYLLDLPSVGLWLENYELMYCKQAFWPQELPGWTRALRKIGVDMLPRSYYTSREALEEWLLEICDRAELDITVMNPTGLSKEPASLYQVLKAAVEIDSPQMSREEQRLEIASELFDQISGAREVLGLVLAYTILYISQNPDAQEKLRNEVLACMPRAKSEDATYHDDRGGDAELKEAQSPAPASLDRLPYLSAVLKESFRMRPNSTPLPRVTPQDRSVSLAGFEIPPSTRVNVFQWFIHRNPETFDCVDEWHPERWISDSGTLKVGSDQPLWAFGSGSRMCVGASLSQYLMKHTLAAIYSRFSSKIVAKKQNVQEPGSLEDEIIVVFESL